MYSTLFSSPEHEVLIVSFCDSAVSVICRASSTFCHVYALEATFADSRETWSDYFFDEIPDKNENGSCQVKN